MKMILKTAISGKMTKKYVLEIFLIVLKTRVIDEIIF